MGSNSSALAKYKMGPVIGKGNAIVYKAQHRKTKQFYAIKFTEPKSPVSDVKEGKVESGSVEELKKESDSLLKLQDCPFICKIYESFMYEKKVEFVTREIKQFWCVVLQYYEEGNLRQRIKTGAEKKSLTGRTKEDEWQIIEWMLQLTEGVGAIHKLNMIHRDLKPENIFLDGDQKLAIGDFGIAIDRTTAHSFVGTLGYYAPEVWKGDGYKAKADMYSLGCILLDLLTLTLAPDRESKNKDRIKLIPSYYSAEWVKIVESLLDEDWTTRWSTADLGLAIQDLPEFRSRTPSNFQFQFSTILPEHMVSDGQSLYINNFTSIALYDLEGTFLRQLQSYDTQFKVNHMEIIFEKESLTTNFYLYILYDKSMTVFNKEHEMIAQWRLPGSQAKDVTGNFFKVGPDRIFLTLLKKHQIYICTSTGNEISRYGSETLGPTPGQFMNPAGLTVDEKFLYVCDFGNHRIQKLLQEDGKFIKQWGQGGNEKKGDFYCPQNILFWENFLYISDKYRVQLFDKEGKFMKYIGTGKSGKRVGEFDIPRGLCVVNKKIYVTDRWNDRIQVFTC